MKMSSEVQTAVGEYGPGIIATVGRNGKPNASVKESLRVLDDEHVLFADIRSPRTVENLKENPQVAVLCVKGRNGVRIWGTAEILTGGSVFDQVAREWAAR